ncbi:hypothetical protein BS47DRAFT_1297052 [Hydnum rufescens UP504]|uniref:Serine aminopeptidase S33 domain-containing protein n=1 Tax=Hydnum rufescens UP504 TaxID=1448309 RepID=A0A9P6AWF8_9AGAM|nr:hypothetical protein BS47DRAFT_1297052 [Hydnum rufescens UP504]
MSQGYIEEWVTYGDGPNKTSFYTRTYNVTSGQPKAHLVFIHGFVEHCGRYDRALSQWAANGISAFTFDQRGYGRTATDKENMSANSSYGKTSWKDQMQDIAFFITRERERIGSGVPMFLMGHSMGGGEVLGFATFWMAETKAALAHLSGIIASAPMIRQATPAPSWKVWAGGKVATIFPNLHIGSSIVTKDLCHDPAIIQAFERDPLIGPYSTIRAISDMLEGGTALAEENYKKWPIGLPILILHGDGDKITSHIASKKFHDDIKANDKHHSIYAGAYHEVHNEPDGVGTRFVDECITWVERHISSVHKL